MGFPKEPKPVKFFVALLTNREDLFRSIENRLRISFGPVDSVSQTLPWNITCYYEEEMGTGLMRRFVSFRPLVSPEELPDLKLKTQSLEENHRRMKGEKKGREVNIDPGYFGRRQGDPRVNQKRIPPHLSSFRDLCGEHADVLPRLLSTFCLHLSGLLLA